MELPFTFARDSNAIAEYLRDETKLSDRPRAMVHRRQPRWRSRQREREGRLAAPAAQNAMHWKLDGAFEAPRVDSLPGMVMRGEAARMLRLFATTRRVQQFEAEGRLRAVVDAKGNHHFARTDVIAFAHQRGKPHADRVHGTIAAQVFALFRESVELPEIVMRTQQSPATIRALYEEYRRPLGDVARAAARSH